MTTPLPVPAEDPAIVAGVALHSTFTLACQSARADVSLTDAGLADLLTAIWQGASDQLVALRTDFEARRAARIAALSSVIPIGPDIPANASAADKAVLMQVFRHALDEAREATREVRYDSLRDALRFGDDTILRAVLTAASDDGQVDIVNVWASTRPELADKLAEISSLRDRLTAGLIARQAFAPLPRPTELDGVGTEVTRKTSGRYAAAASLLAA